MIKKYSILVLFFIVSFSIKSQYKSTKLKMAEGLAQEGKYFAALNIYEDIAKNQGEIMDIYFKIAQLHEQLYNYTEASKWYYKLFEIQSGEYPKSEYKFAELQMILGNYKIAQEYFISFGRTYKGYDKYIYTKLCKQHIKSCKISIGSLPNAEISVKRIPKFINSTFNDLSPFAYNGKLYYSSIPSDSAITYKGDLDSAPTFQIFMANQIKDEKFDSATLFIPEIINKPYSHTSNGSFGPEGEKFFFTRCKKNINGKNICKIYCSIKNDTSWNKPIQLNSEINDKNNDFSSTHPVIMTYKKRGQKSELVTKIIFSSTMPGGLGGYDIWMASINNDLEIGTPENMGKKVNSSFNELTPYYSKTEKKLYFSSNGHGGFGGLDIFKASIKNGKAKKIKPLDNPINSSWDDWYYNQMNLETAFIVSNRKGAQTYHENIRLDDIFIIKKEAKKYLSLYAFGNDSSSTLLSSAVFKIKFANDNISEIKQVETGKVFQIIPNKTYEIIAQKNGYFNASTLFSMPYDTKSDTVKWNFKLIKIDTLNGVIIDNLYFDNDSYELKPESKQALNKLYKLLIINPSLRIQIAGHTNNKGSDAYNMVLSQKRAQSVVNYLVNKGISLDVISAKGYGKSRPISENKNIELNRRIVLKVINENNLENLTPKK